MSEGRAITELRRLFTAGRPKLSQKNQGAY
jgi:hypothetical protein